MLREQTAALQLALIGTLKSCQAIGEQAHMDDTLLTHLQSLRQAVQDLSPELSKTVNFEIEKETMGDEGAQG